MRLISTTAINLAALLVASAAAAPAVHAQINKCLDKTGKVVAYGNDCPPGTRAASTGIRNAPSAPAASSSEKSLAERDAEFRKRQIERQEAQSKEQKKLADEETRRQSCESARSYLKGLQSGVRMARTDPDTGERVYLDDAARAKETIAAQRAMEANCK